jgi:olfactory receptor
MLAALHESLTALRLNFCTIMEMPHYFCELSKVLKLAYSDTLINNMVFYIMSGILSFFPLSWIVYSYSQIVVSVLSISTTGGKHKAFSTCGSQL